MKCAPCTYSPAQVADYSPTSSLDTLPLWPSSGTPTAVKFCESAQQTDGSPTCTCTRETFGCLIHRTTSAEWIALQQDSLASLTQSLARAEVPTTNAICGPTLRGSLASYDPAISGWKMSQASLLPDMCGPSSEIWPPWGMTVGGELYPQPTPEQISIAPGGGASLPAPTASWAQRGPGLSFTGRKRYADGMTQLTLKIVREIGWRWPAKLIELMMMWPIGYTELRHSATVKSRCKPRSHGKSSEAREK